MSDRGKAIPASEMLQIGTEPSRGTVRLLRCDFSYRKYKFEAVYDFGPVAGKYNAEGASITHIERMADKMRQQTYLHHVCTRCGCIVNRPSTPTVGEKTP